MGAKWLRNGQAGGQTWSSGGHNGGAYDDQHVGMMGGDSRKQMVRLPKFKG